MKIFKNLSKILLLVLLVGALAFTFAACGKKDKEKEKEKVDITTYITVHEDDAAVKHAAYELSTYSMKASGNPINAYTPAAWAKLDNMELTPTADKTIYMGTSSWFKTYYPEFMMDLYENSLTYDGYVIAPVEGGYAIMSNYNRGVLYGTYSVLKSNGFGFYGYLENYEYIPSLYFVEFPEKITVNNPTFEVRSIEYTGTVADYTEETDYVRMLSWAAKNGINEVVSDVYSTYVGNALANNGFASLRGKAPVVDRANPTSGSLVTEPTKLETLGYRISDRSSEISTDIKAFESAGVKGVSFSVEKNVTGFMFDSDIYCIANAMWNSNADLNVCAKALFDFKYEDSDIKYETYSAAAASTNGELKAKVDALYSSITADEEMPAYIVADESAKIKLSSLYSDYVNASAAEKQAKLEALNEYALITGYFN